MRVVVQQKNFKKGIYLTERLVSKNISLPILNNILLKTENGRLKMISTNLEIGITCAIGAKIDETGEIAVPGKILSEFINTTGDENITLTTKNNSLFIATDKYKTTVLGADTKEYPIIPKVKGETICKIPASVLRTVLMSAVDTIATTETRAELSGLYTLFKEKGIIFAATDSFRLVEKKITLNCASKHAVIIPRNAITELIRLSAEDNSEFEIKIGENQISFISEDVEMVSRLIEGTYPDYSKVIPEKANSKILVKKNDLEKAIRLAGLFSSNIADIKIQTTQNKVSVFSKNTDKGDAHADVEAILKNEPFDISLNYGYLLDGLKIIPTDKVILEFLSSSSPVVLRPDNERNDLLYLVMPLRN